MLTENPVPVYIPEALIKVKSIYGPLLKNYTLPIKKRLERMAILLFEAIKNQEEAACIEVSNYHPDFLGKSAAFIFNSNFDVSEAKRTIAAEHGFQSWQQVEHLGADPIDQVFESSIDFLVEGNVTALKRQLSLQPALLHKTSQYGHRATLLHYTGSNGVEIYRQQVPLNLPEITQMLLNAGADKQAKMKVYDGEFDTLTLLKSSAHPYDAGIASEMIKVLETY